MLLFQSIALSIVSLLVYSFAGLYFRLYSVRTLLFKSISRNILDAVFFNLMLYILLLYVQYGRTYWEEKSIVNLLDIIKLMIFTFAVLSPFLIPLNKNRLVASIDTCVRVWLYKRHMWGSQFGNGGLLATERFIVTLDSIPLLNSDRYILNVDVYRNGLELHTHAYVLFDKIKLRYSDDIRPSGYCLYHHVTRIRKEPANDLLDLQPEIERRYLPQICKSLNIPTSTIIPMEIITKEIKES